MSDDCPAPAHTLAYHPPSDREQPLRWLHEDEALLVVDKPSGLLSVPGRGPQRQDCVASRVQQRCADALIVHRLDMGTSGLLVMARGLPMQRRLSAAFAERRVHKRYVALVGGHLADGAGEVDLPLICDWPRRPRQKVDRIDGKAALTRWTVLERGEREGWGPWTRVELEPVTGRSHQLRVHLLSLGHPIIGDELYAPPELAGASPRLLLHAQRLELDHPQQPGQTLRLHSDAPF